MRVKLGRHLEPATSLLGGRKQSTDEQIGEQLRGRSTHAVRLKYGCDRRAVPPEDEFPHWPRRPDASRAKHRHAFSTFATAPGGNLIAGFDVTIDANVEIVSQ